MENDSNNPFDELTRRTFLGAAVAGSVVSLEGQAVSAGGQTVACTLTVNQTPHKLNLDPRITLLDLLRERLGLTGTKKGCDHGQCGACTVIVNGERINSCLTLAVAHDGEAITTIEGLAAGDKLHPVQEAFLANDGFQCGFCTPGQICSAVSVLKEARRGMPSAVTNDLSTSGPIALTKAEVRERMSGNLCRCGAYTNLVAAVLASNGGEIA